ncbi:hypothetical protein QBC38DRAFT_469278 [Podospora fimiseda]|uniref:Uncharacterized protein n=1 Tax=Podospora fimiseda TaxID=252190 RepID=A0AAN7GZY5_9PEZI|nr:hypothetical protein QBC38DRAFT_469278 [Podospora fimiseda]
MEEGIKQVASDKNPLNPTRNFWWYWEIGVCLLSVLLIGLLIVFLMRINQRRRSTWTLGVEPNTVMAIFATLMMVSVVSCISQLKWNHFKVRANPLHHLDIIDDCSRGPWGAFNLLIRTPGANPIISVLAAVTIIALGMEPVAQQLLETRHRIAPLNNASAEIDVALSWSSEALKSLGAF